MVLRGRPGIAAGRGDHQREGRGARFTQLTAGTAWGGGAPVALGVAKTPGLLVGTVSAKGQAKGVSGKEAVLAVVTFALNERKPSALDFVVQRSALLNTSGKPIEGVGFAGGDLVLK